MIQPDKTAPRRSKLSPTSPLIKIIFFRLLPLCLCLIALVVVAGRMVGDISPFFQWLSWIPVLVLLPILLVALLLSLKDSGRGSGVLRSVCGGFLLLALIWTATVDYAFLRTVRESEDDLLLVNWNATILPGEDSFENALVQSNRALKLLTDLDADVLIIFNGSYLRLSSQWKAFEDRFSHAARSAMVMVLSDHEILEVRPILVTRGSLIISIRVRHQGEERIIWGIDLPSSPRLSRSELFASLRAQLDEMDEAEPDLLLGDFNVPRDSRSLRRAFPDFRSAFSEAGSGWHGTWPREFPLWDLDQVLVGPGLAAVRYEVVTPPIGMHRIQKVVLRW